MSASYAVIDSWETVYSTGDLRPGDLLFFLEQRQNAHLSYRNMAGRRKIRAAALPLGSR